MNPNQIYCPNCNSFLTKKDNITLLKNGILKFSCSCPNSFYIEEDLNNDDNINNMFQYMCYEPVNQYHIFSSKCLTVSNLHSTKEYAKTKSLEIFIPPIIHNNIIQVSKTIDKFNLLCTFK